ncbi:amidase signature domain-containing protein [Nemania abortiva]|nr:amidase signature domain-containing protein [Nemania abortiva]
MDYIVNPTLAEVSQQLEKGRLTSVDLVKAYANHIKKYDKNGCGLNAIISLVPEEIVKGNAMKMDKERDAGKTRSCLHGIPFLVKDNLWTEKSSGLPTTCGTVAFEHTFAKKNADIVQKLVDAGMVLLGKTNLSELAFAKSSEVWGGWSAIGGQTQSPYVLEGIAPDDTFLGHSTPAGSSAGSAVAVAAGMAPVAVATETDGSITMPADRASLYSIRLSPSTSTRGMLSLNKLGDSIGWMTKSAEDVALLLDVVLDKYDRYGRDGGCSYTRYLTESFKDLKIGFLDPMEWRPGTALVKPNEDYDKQFMAEFNDVLFKLESAGAVVHRNIDLRRWSGEDSEILNALTYHDYAAGFAEFAKGLIEPPVTNIPEMIEFNKKHADRAMPCGNPGQDFLEKTAANMDSLTKDEYHEYQKTVLSHTRDLGIDAAMKRYDLDVIMGAPTGRSATIYDIAGYPVGTVPLGYAKFNGRAFGLSFVVQEGRKDLIIRVMGAWEELLSPRKPPPQTSVELLGQYAGTRQG